MNRKKGLLFKDTKNSKHKCNHRHFGVAWVLLISPDRFNLSTEKSQKLNTPGTVWGWNPCPAEQSRSKNPSWNSRFPGISPATEQRIHLIHCCTKKGVFCVFQSRTCTHALRNLSFSLAWAAANPKLPASCPMKLMRHWFSLTSPSGEMHQFQVTLLPYSVFAVINNVSLTLLPCRTEPTLLLLRGSKMFLSESSPTNQA